ncbi:hypothetical protein B0H14DRAFT_2621905, partial [Mycena olivaceomarginata]
MVLSHTRATPQCGAPRPTESPKHSQKTAPSDPAAERAKRALELFDHLAWTGDVKGLKAGGSISDLALWYTADWLTTDHEDGMLEMLADDLGLSDGGKNSVQPTYFVHGLARAYMNPNTYRTA